MFDLTISTLSSLTAQLPPASPRKIMLYCLESSVYSHTGAVVLYSCAVSSQPISLLERRAMKSPIHIPGWWLCLYWSSGAARAQFHFLRQSGAGIMKLVHLPAAFITALILTLSLLIHCYTSTVIEFRATKNIHIAFIIQSTALGWLLVFGPWAKNEQHRNIHCTKFNIKRWSRQGWHGRYDAVSVVATGCGEDIDTVVYQGGVGGVEHFRQFQELHAMIFTVTSFVDTRSKIAVHSAPHTAAGR